MRQSISAGLSSAHVYTSNQIENVEKQSRQIVYVDFCFVRQPAARLRFIAALILSKSIYIHFVWSANHEMLFNKIRTVQTDSVAVT